MYMNEYTLQTLHEDRLQDAARAQAHYELVQAARGQRSGLLAQVKQMAHLPTRQTRQVARPQTIRDTRTVHAV